MPPDEPSETIPSPVPSPSPAAASTPAPDDRDLVAVEVLLPDGLRCEGRMYRKGQTLVTTRAKARAKDAAGRPAFRVLRTIHFERGPRDQAEQPPGGGFILEVR